jgi:8-oxo-dGTP pyrophosphatase MutT (NUDIX family)
VHLKQYKNSSRAIDNSWCLPGGGLEEGEALRTGLEREMIEETGIQAKVGNLLYNQQFIYNNVDFLEFFFHVTNSEDFLSIDLANTTHGLLEIEEISFVDPKTTPLLPKFLMTEPITQKVLSNEPPKIFSYVD